ncbi:helix-turn-helix domain-containing protein [Salmonella enterica]|nr:helix-turn-helix domain-containing protein [Salmonella enterica]HAF5679600.1 helix-turn-helix domain-containing protein [Salmonella enterica]
MNPETRSKLHLLITQRAIAQNLGVTPQAVNLWFNKAGIPPRFILPVCELVGWKITPHELSPDLYPHPADGLPDRASEKA